MAKDFTVGVLLYGDHVDLARRCLGSLSVLPRSRVNIRVAMNAVCPATRHTVLRLRAQEKIDQFFDSDTNLHKYPAMREIVNCVNEPYLMWFDDDSYLATGVDGHNWLDQVVAHLRECSMIGSIYSIALQGNQRQWIKQQPWYRGRDPNLRSHLRFCTGGWWAARTHVLQELGYPWAELDHRGGDVMLGEALFQIDRCPAMFRDGVHINADEQGRESKAPRRGFDQVPIGADFGLQKPPPAVPLLPEPVTSKPARRPVLQLDI